MSHTEPTRLYIIAGEASGDMHGANLIKALHRIDASIQVRAWGGDAMQVQGATIVKHYKDLAFMGFVEVLKNLWTILNNFAFGKSDILSYAPHALVLIDYPGFNLRMAKWAKNKGIPVIYYISPQIWAWHTSRVHGIKATVDQMLVILPFERDFYQKYGMEVEYVGHPLIDALEVPPAGAPRQDIILLMPGSRMQEIKVLLPLMLSVVPHFEQYRFVVAAATTIAPEVYSDLLAKNGLQNRVEVVVGKSHELMRKAKAGLIKSGTSTLESALHRLPEVVCYKGNPISYAIAKRVVQIKYISLVNLILDRPLVKELIQEDCNTMQICAELQQILQPEVEAKIQAGYQELIDLLGAGQASKKAAESIIRFVDQKKAKKYGEEDH